MASGMNFGSNALRNSLHENVNFGDVCSLPDDLQNEGIELLRYNLGSPIDSDTYACLTQDIDDRQFHINPNEESELLQTIAFAERESCLGVLTPSPTPEPTPAPSNATTRSPTFSLTDIPTSAPTSSLTPNPTPSPTAAPTFDGSRYEAETNVLFLLDYGWQITSDESSTKTMLTRDLMETTWPVIDGSGGNDATIMFAMMMKIIVVYYLIQNNIVMYMNLQINLKQHMIVMILNQDVVL